jgi:hypothetical protein
VDGVAKVATTATYAMCESAAEVEALEVVRLGEIA